jgi:hypothetical protein
VIGKTTAESESWERDGETGKMGEKGKELLKKCMR